MPAITPVLLLACYCSKFFKFCTKQKHVSGVHGAVLLSSLLFLCCTTATQAQTPKLSCIADCSCDMFGRVVDQLTKQPLAYATVQLKGSSVGTIADEKGIFHLHNLCQDEFDLMVSFVGYKPVVHHHDLYHDDPVIYLSPEDAQLEGIVIEGVQAEAGMSSANISTLGRAELESINSNKLGDALSKLPGVTTISTGQNVVKPVIHGLHSSRILIINNGLRHESQSWGIDHAPEIDPALAGNIRLIKGAASVRYGPGALGGVVLVDPVQPRLTSELDGSLKLNLQSNGKAAGGTALLQEGYSNFGWVAQASGLYQGDLHAPDYQLTNTGARELGLSAGALYHRRQLDLNLYYSYFRQRLGILRGSVVGNLRDLAFAIGSEPPAGTTPFSYSINTPFQQVNHHLLKLRGTYTFDNSSLELLYGFQANERQEFDLRRGSLNETPSINLQLSTHSLEASWLHPDWSVFSGVAGLQAQYQDNNNIAGTGTTPFLPNYNNLNLGFFVAETIRLGKSTADAGLRYDLQWASARGRKQNQEIFSNDFYYQSITASAGILHPLNAYLNLRSNLGLAWRPPNMSELYSFGKHGAVVEFGLLRFLNGNTGVYDETEVPIQNELSYKWVNTLTYAHDKLHFELTAYLNYIQHYIFSKPAGITTTTRGTFPFFIFDQTDALLAGFDGSFALALSKHWSSGLRFMLLKASNLKNEDRFVGLPPNRLSYTLEYHLPKLGMFSNFTASLEPTYVFEQFQAPPVITPTEILQEEVSETQLMANAENGFDFLAAPEGYLLLNLSAAVEQGQFSYRLGIRNLLNTSYRDYTNRLRYFADEPGRNLVLSAKYRF